MIKYFLVEDGNEVVQFYYSKQNEGSRSSLTRYKTQTKNRSWVSVNGKFVTIFLEWHPVVSEVSRSQSYRHHSPPETHQHLFSHPPCPTTKNFIQSSINSGTFWTKLGEQFIYSFDFESFYWITDLFLSWVQRSEVRKPERWVNGSKTRTQKMTTWDPRNTVS